MMFYRIVKFRWLRFSLMSLFVAITAIAGMMGYQVYWIRQRHAMLRMPHVYYSDAVPVLGMNLVITPEVEKVRAPWLLSVFGELGIASIQLPIEPGRFDESRAPETYPEVRRARALFPEATHIEVYPIAKP